jgi:epoxyqueuosine reductase
VSSPSTDLDSRVRAQARALGFDVVGVARADVPLEEDFLRYEAFLGAGMEGEMTYLAENAPVRARLDTDAILAGAKSIICVARRYQRAAADEAQDPPFAQQIARYARGRDYHNGMRRKLRQLAAFVRSLGTAEHPVNARPMVDDVPVLERAWAARAGLGFVGKNGMLIAPGEGSFVLLGEVVTTLALMSDTPMTEKCGACTRCLDACPTRAFPRPFVLDPRRCIAYLTIEHRSAVPLDQREGIGTHLFGCDDCQTVCPFNRSSRPRSAEATRPFAPHSRWSETEVVDLLALDEARWRALSEGSPLRRATAEGLARNAAIVLANGGEARTAEEAGEAEERSRVERALAAAAERHPAAMVREAAAWGRDRLARRPSQRATRQES